MQPEAEAAAAAAAAEAEAEAEAETDSWKLARDGLVQLLGVNGDGCTQGGAVEGYHLALAGELAAAVAREALVGDSGEEHVRAATAMPGLACVTPT